MEFADGQLSGNLLRRPIESTPRAEIHSRNERTLVPLLETESSKGAIAEPVANLFQECGNSMKLGCQQKVNYIVEGNLGGSQIQV